jgi:hypothetical protein
MALISNARNAGRKLNLSNLKVDIEDVSFLSEYFVLSEYSPKFTAGKNTFLLNGSDKLASNTQIQIEALDCFGNSLYVEVAKTNNVAYKEGGAIRVAVYIYSDTPYGVGKIIVVSSDKSNKVVRWIGNMQINPSIQNTSKVVFYKSPTLSVTSTYVPLLTDQSSGYTTTLTNTPVTTYAVIPKKNDDYGLFDIGTSPIDYRLNFLDNTLIVSSSMKNALVTVYATELDGGITTNLTSSNVVTDILDEHTVKLKNPIYYVDNKNKKIVSNITNGSLSAIITNVKYDGRFLTSSSVNQSVAFVTYTNLKTFSGNIYRHKLYRRSLSSAGDFEIIADEPFVDSQSLIDQSTSNSYFKSLGSFPNNTHVHHYWFSSSTSINFTRDASYLMDAIQITNNTTDAHYVIVKNDTNAGSANHVYTPYNKSEDLSEFGMAYDSNFMKFYPDVTYKFSFRSKIVKFDASKPASVGFYITSSLFNDINVDTNYDTNRGLKIGEIYLDERSSSLYHPEPSVFYSRFSKEFNGTMVIYTNNCVSTLSDLQFSTYSEPSFSPEIFATRIPFPVNVAGEQFEIKSELFDVNSNLVYSDLRTITTFDPSGSTLAKNIPGITTSDTTNGLTLFNLIVSTQQTSPQQGISMLDASRFNFDVSGSGAHTANDATFHIKKGTVSISPQIASGVGGAVYINPSTTLEINPTTLGTMNNVDIGQTVHKKGKFTDLEATTSATVPTTTAPGTVSATVTSTSLAATPGTVDVVCPLKAPDGWLLINGKKVPFYN